MGICVHGPYGHVQLGDQEDSLECCARDARDPKAGYFERTLPVWRTLVSLLRPIRVHGRLCHARSFINPFTPIHLLTRGSRRMQRILLQARLFASIRQNACLEIRRRAFSDLFGHRGECFMSIAFFQHPIDANLESTYVVGPGGDRSSLVGVRHTPSSWTLKVRVTRQVPPQLNAPAAMPTTCASSRAFFFHCRSGLGAVALWRKFCARRALAGVARASLFELRMP